MAGITQPAQHHLVEPLIRTIKIEQVDLSENLDFHEAYYPIWRLIEYVCIRRRIRSSLINLTAADSEIQSRTWQAADGIEESPFWWPLFGEP